jgi:hypothetical protein
LKNDSSLGWETAQLNLLALTNRITLGLNCNDCPMLPSLTWGTDRIYTTGGAFYFLQYFGSKQLFQLSSTLTKISDITLTATPVPRPFTHPDINAFVVATQPTALATNAALVLFDASDSFLEGDNSQSALPSAFLVGKLFFNDQIPYGNEVVEFAGPNIKRIWHHYPTPAMVEDPNWESQLNWMIEGTQGGDSSPIQAAFIDDLNHDQFPDLLYVRSGRVYVTSYVGLQAGVPFFRDWKSTIAAITGETVQSLTAVDLTADGYPDLVIETDQYVHFYVNHPQ